MIDYHQLYQVSMNLWKYHGACFILSYTVRFILLKDILQYLFDTWNQIFWCYEMFTLSYINYDYFCKSNMSVM